MVLSIIKKNYSLGIQTYIYIALTVFVVFITWAWFGPIASETKSDVHSIINNVRQAEVQFNISHVDLPNPALGKTGQAPPLGNTGPAPPKYELPTDHIQVLPMTNISRLIYTRFPKCASSTTMFLFENITKQNKIFYPKDIDYDPNFINHTLVPNCSQCGDLHGDVKKEMSIVEYYNRLPDRSLLSGHITHIDFRRYQQSNLPVYISVVREPFERIVSLYYFLHNKLHLFSDRPRLTFDDCVEKNMAFCRLPGGGTLGYLPFFCGINDRCSKYDEVALNIAKNNIMRDFPFIGVFEQYTDTLDIVEYMFPQYFKGVRQLFTSQNERKDNVTPRKVSPKNSTIALVKSLLPLDYDLYNFIKQRFYVQHKIFKHVSNTQ